MAKSFVPTLRPVLALEKLEKELAAKGIIDAVKVVGVRAPIGKNRRRQYDDAIYLIAPGFFMAFNANCDPNGVRPGHGKSEKTKGMASLKEGAYHSHKVGTHKKGTKTAHTALIQTAGPVVVLRDADKTVPAESIVMLDGVRCYLDGPAYLGINIHKGGDWSTSSLGCQTIPPAQWPMFIKNVIALLARHKQTVVPYLLTRVS